MRYPAHVAVGDSPDVLLRIREPGINLAIWERSLDPALKRWLDTLSFACMPHGTCEGDGLSAFGLSLRSQLLARTGSDSGQELLARDLEMCAELFMGVKDESYVGGQLRRHKFTHPRQGVHIDGVHYRMGITYRGTRGMLWVPNAQVEWQNEEEPARDGRGRISWHGEMCEVSPYAVSVLRGTWKTSGAKPLVHEAPFMREGDPDRLVGLLH